MNKCGFGYIVSGAIWLRLLVIEIHINYTWILSLKNIEVKQDVNLYYSYLYHSYFKCYIQSWFSNLVSKIKLFCNNIMIWKTDIVDKTEYIRVKVILFTTFNCFLMASVEDKKFYLLNYYQRLLLASVSVSYSTISHGWAS